MPHLPTATQNHQQQGNLVLMNFQPAKEKLLMITTSHHRIRPDFIKSVWPPHLVWSRRIGKNGIRGAHQILLRPSGGSLSSPSLTVTLKSDGTANERECTLETFWEGGEGQDSGKVSRSLVGPSRRQFRSQAGYCKFQGCEIGLTVSSLRR